MSMRSFVILLVCMCAATMEASSICLSEWVVAGPFSRMRGIDALSDGGVKVLESSVNLKSIAVDGRSYFGLSVRSVQDRQMIDFYSSLEIAKGDDDDGMIFYAECRLHSDEDAKYNLLIGSDGVVTIYVNNRVVAEAVQPRKVQEEPIAARIPIDVSAGENRILFKIDGCKSSCGLSADVEDTGAPTLAKILHRNRSFLKDIVTSPGGIPVFELRGAEGCELEGGVLHVYNEKGEEVAVMRSPANGMPLSAEKLPDGIYRAVLILGGANYQDGFVVGDPVKCIEATIRQCSESTGNAKLDEDLKTVVHRLMIVKGAYATSQKERDWQRKVVYTCSEAKLIMKSGLTEGGTAWRQQVGLHLRAFRSGIDGQIRHYRIFIPTAAKAGEKVPLAVIFPTLTSANREFIESAFVAKHLQAEYICGIAERLGMAILWPGYPTQPNGNPADLAHFVDVYYDVIADVRIDEQRIHFLAVCQGAVSALTFAEHWPQGVASLALLDPVPDRIANTTDNESAYWKLPEYRTYIKSVAPNNNLARLCGIPLIVAFDDGGIGHGTRRQSEELYKQIKEGGVSAEYAKLPLGLDHMLAWENMLGWCVGKAKGNDSFRRFALEESDHPNTLGWALAKGFILVVGTSGTEKDSINCRRIAKEFSDAWKQAFFRECRVIEDGTVTEDMIRTLNLVLIGNESCNTLWQRYAPACHLEITENSLNIGAIKRESTAIAIQAVLPNLDYPDRSIVFWGSHCLDGLSFGKRDWAGNGWYRFAIWKRKDRGGSYSLVETLTLEPNSMRQNVR